MLQRYPFFRYQRSLITDGRIILLDEPLAQPIREELQLLSTKDGQGLVFLEAADLAVDLETILAALIEKNHQALMVFPGNGSRYPYSLSPICQAMSGAWVPARRLWIPGSDPIVMAGLIWPKIFLATEVKTILVVDDVISSGKTLEKLYQNNSWRFPQARWIGLSWVAQIPQVKAPAGVRGYDLVETVCVVGRTNGARAPINSISTLRQNPERAKSYAERHFVQASQFLRLITI